MMSVHVPGVFQWALWLLTTSWLVVVAVAVEGIPRTTAVAAAVAVK